MPAMVDRVSDLSSAARIKNTFRRNSSSLRDEKPTLNSSIQELQEEPTPLSIELAELSSIRFFANRADAPRRFYLDINTITGFLQGSFAKYTILGPTQIHHPNAFAWPVAPGASTDLFRTILQAHAGTSESSASQTLGQAATTE